MIKAAIVGATGYTGLELMRILLRHPNVQISQVTSRTRSGELIADTFPSLREFCNLKFSEPKCDSLAKSDVVFFATPHAVAMHSIPELYNKGVKVIDLSADFRLRDIAVWEKWYASAHLAADLQPAAVYGLPEVNREKIKQARLIACPGCYPTAVQLALMPLLSSGAITSHNLIVNAASGVTGAGRQAKLTALHAEVSESFSAYAAAGHRHLPEIQQGLQDMSDQPVSLSFVPHLLPMNRGILATVYTQLVAQQSLDDIQRLFEETYASDIFVDVMPQGSHPSTASVRGTNMCRVAIHQQYDSGHLIVLSVIDNLVKGASGQAVQCMNIMFGLPESAGLELVAMRP